MSSVSIILVNRHGELSAVKTVYSELTLFKKCGYKSASGFDQQAEWGLTDDIRSSHDSCRNISCVALFGKRTGNSENKYEFPAPVDTDLFFGTCALVGFTDAGDAVSLTMPAWEIIYDALMGGFEDLEDTCEADEIVSVASVEDRSDLTKTGYKKDGFVVEDDEDSSDLTKTGYKKDGFVVEDDDEDSIKDPDEDESEYVPDDDSDSDNSQLSEETYESETEPDSESESA